MSKKLSDKDYERIINEATSIVRSQSDGGCLSAKEFDKRVLKESDNLLAIKSVEKKRMSKFIKQVFGTND